MNEEDVYNKGFSCPECQAGVMRLKYVAYFTWLGDDLITVPEFPAWVCDVCGRRDYDSRAVSWLNTMLNAGFEHRRGRGVSTNDDSEERPHMPTA